MRSILIALIALFVSAPAYSQDAPEAAPTLSDAVVDGGSAAARFPMDDARVVANAPTPSGATGLLRTAQATGLEPGTFGLFLYTEYFGGQSVVRDGDESRRFIGRMGLSYTPIEYVEAWVRLGARATTNTFGDPRLIQSVGDFGLGVKGMIEFSDGLHAGLMLDLDVPAGSNSVGLDFGATSLDIVALFTADFRPISDIPLRAHFNTGFLVDNSASLFDVRLDRVERFGHFVYDYSRALIALAVDAPLPYATPFVEWALEIPTQAPCDGTNPQLCVKEEGAASYPSFLTVGVRSQPVRGLSFLAAMDLGLTTAESQGTPAVPAWNLVLGASYNLNPFGGTERVVEVPVEVPVGIATSYVEGFVQDAGTGEPIADAMVSYLGQDGLSTHMTDSSGRFRTYDFEPGTPLTLTVSHPNYVAGEFEVAVAAEVVSGPIGLEPAFEGTLLSGRVEATGPVDAVVSLLGETRVDLTVEDGRYEAEVPAGSYTVVVHALGHDAVVEQRELPLGRVEANYTLEALPANARLRRTADELAIDSPMHRVGFDDAGDIEAEGRATLQAVAAAMAADPSLRLLVRAHTDPREDTVAELQIAAERAEKVKQALVALGVDAGRLETDGVGSAEPRYPNVTERNMRLNNRIEFQLLD